MQVDDEIRQALYDTWGISEKSTQEEIEVALCDAKMENTRLHTIISFQGKVMIDGEQHTAKGLWEML